MACKAKEEVVKKEGPQYGGTLTVFYWCGYDDIKSPDPTESGTWPSEQYLVPVLERILMGDVDKYGPRGTNEYSFYCDKATPLEYCTGALVESWEVTPDSIVFKVRPGIYYSGISLNPGVMEPREFVADDITLHLNRRMESPGGATLRACIDRVYTKDKYTCVVETPRLFLEWWWELSSRSGSNIMPRESVEAGSRDWGNLVGTGPFVVKEYVPGAYMKYARNANYWRTTTINGKVYDDIPFVDELVMPFMVDKATQIAALRTGALDAHFVVGYVYQDALDKTCPDLLSARETSGDPYGIYMRTDFEPLSNKKVRQALMKGLNLKFIQESTMLGGESGWFPIAPGTRGHIPIEELPPEIKLLFDYDPDLAKQMMIDAGYPDGFKAEIMVRSGAFGDIVTQAEMISGMWEELGVELEISVHDSTVYSKRKNEKTHGEFTISNVGGATTLPFSTFRTHFLPGAITNLAMYDNPYLTELYYKAEDETDPVKQATMLEELSLIVLDDVLVIPVAVPFSKIYWWPWVKNYYGEADQGGRITPPWDSMWLDQNLKAEMGFEK